MSDFVPRHVSEKVGAYAGGARRIGPEDIAWILSRKQAGLPDQHIATMANVALQDVQRVCAEFLPKGFRPPQRAAYRPAPPPTPRLMRTAMCVRLVADNGIGHAMLARPATPKESWRMIIAKVAREFGVTSSDILGPRRTPQALIRARQKAMWVLHVREGWSLPRVGEMLGGRDHTTVLHGVRAHAARTQTSPLTCQVAA